jgi:hypothetical protein
VIGRSGLADAVAGIVQVFIDNTGAITWNDAPAPPTPVTTFPSNVFPLSVISVDSACRVFDVIDARTFLSF